MADEHTNDAPETLNHHEAFINPDAVDADTPEEPKSRDGGILLQVAVVSVDLAEYGIRLGTVREILRVPKITWIPWTPKYIVGILSVRGEMLPIVDLRLFLQHGAGRVTGSSRIVVVEFRDLAAGLLVDAMVDIFDIPLSAFWAAAAEFDESHHEPRKYCAGHFKWQEMPLPLLDTDLLLQDIVVNQA